MGSAENTFFDVGPLVPFKRWGTKWSLWPVHFVTACCGVELAHAFASGYDAERIGALSYGIARQTNFIIVEGAITRKMARALRVTWEQMPDQKFVIVIGACGERGGIFWNGYNMIRPSDVVPVDFFVPGCPPTPEGLIKGIRTVQEKIYGKGRTTIEFKKVESKSLFSSLSEEEKKEKGLPTSPKIFAPTPLIRIDVQKEVDWDFGKRLVDTLKEELSGVYKSITITGKNRVAIRTTAGDIVKIAEKIRASDRLKMDHVKSVNVIEVPHEKKLIVEYIVSSYTIKELMPVLITIFAEIPSEGNKKFPSLCSLWENADYLEREMHDFFGIFFEGNKGMGSKFILAPDTPDTPLRKEFKLREERYAFDAKEITLGISEPPPKELSMPISEDFFEDACQSDDYIVLVGPQHPGSGHFRMIVRLKGDIIVEVIPDAGYVHRSMEKLGENRLYIQNIPLFERASINDPANMNLGYVRVIEGALGVEVPERAQYIRTIMAELSRIGAFFYDAAILSILLGHSTGFTYGFSIRELITEAMVKISGARMTTSFIVPGGIRRNVSEEVLDWIKSSTSAVLKRLEKFENIFIKNPVTVARTKDVGVLTKEEAIKYGLVGPFLRASGVEYDIRKVAPYEVYDRLEWEIPVSDKGDSLARFLVRVEEVKQSLSLIRQAVDMLRELPKGEGQVLSEDVLCEFREATGDIRGHFYRVFGNLVLPRGEWTSITEAGRGSLIYTIISDGESNVPYRVRMLTPSWLNLKGYIESLKGYRLADLQAIYASFGYFPPEADR